MFNAVRNFVHNLTGKPRLCDICHEREAVGSLCNEGPVKITFLCEECRKKLQNKDSGNIIAAGFYKKKG